STASLVKSFMPSTAVTKHDICGDNLVEFVTRSASGPARLDRRRDQCDRNEILVPAFPSCPPGKNLFCSFSAEYTANLVSSCSSPTARANRLIELNKNLIEQVQATRITIGPKLFSEARLSTHS